MKRKHEEMESAASNQLARCTIDVGNNARITTAAAADNKGKYNSGFTFEL